MSESQDLQPPSSVSPAGGPLPEKGNLERLIGLARGSGAERLSAALKDRRALVLVGLLFLAQASGLVDLSPVFVWMGLAPRAEDVWGHRHWGASPWGDLPTPVPMEGLP